MGAPHTRPLSDLRAGDAPLFGGKSASLGELIGAGIPVPPGFALSSTAYHAFAGEAAPAGLTGEEMRDAMRARAVPDEVRTELARAYAGLGAADGPDPAVAVRSSALGEDSTEATFAGQQDTYLWVRGLEPLCHAVRDCWASLYSPEAIAYRAQMAPPGRPAMGVAVQVMVDAGISGVMFTCNPVSGDPSTVAVNASWGLGLAVVGGEVTPDEYRVSKVTREVLETTIGPKRIEYVPDPAGHGAVSAEVPAERQEAACLSDDDLGVLVEVARRVERHFGCHQDIEWAIAQEGSLPSSLFVLQSRPVTAAPEKAKGPGGRSAISLVMDTFGAGEGS